MTNRICERCSGITPHKLILEAKFHECQRCHKVSRRYDTTKRPWAGH